MKTRQGPADVFHAIADPTRRRILDLLGRGDQPVTSIARRFDVTMSAISQHMRVLREAGMVSARREGRERLYRLEPSGLGPVRTWVRRHEAFWREKMDRLGRQLEDES
jgi:DNA-binding transcriptional ArsR family regulator